MIEVVEQGVQLVDVLLEPGARSVVLLLILVEYGLY